MFGGHGCGLVAAWAEPCVEWLTAQGFASAEGEEAYIYDFADGYEYTEVQRMFESA